MNRRNLLAAAAGAAAGLLAFAAFAAPDSSGGRVLVAGMDAAYPPFGSVDVATREFVGFDVDIIRAIARQAGFEVEIANMAFDGLIPALRTGNIDIAINDMTITEERAKSVDFSSRYYVVGMGVVVNADNTDIREAKDLEGRRLAVSIGSTGEEAARGIRDAKVSVFNQINECFLELVNRGVEAVLGDTATNDYYIAHAGRGRVKALPVSLENENLGIAVKKGNRELLEKINSGLAAIKKSGEFSAIHRKWFGRDPSDELLRE